MILVIDNYDSFVHNLARYFRQLGVETQTLRNDRVDVAMVRQLAPRAIVISPGPCDPDQAGATLEIIKAFVDSVPLLGVCLGHQAIVQALGGEIVRSWQPMHGRASEVQHVGSRLFEKVPDTFFVGRYHSLIVQPTSLPTELRVTSKTGDGIVMSVEHETLPVVGVQFHPESILTEHGHQILYNFLKLADCLPKSTSADLCTTLMQSEMAVAGGTR